MAVGVLLVAMGFQAYTLRHLPVKDYRPYAVGEDIQRNMASAAELGLDPPKFDKEVRFHNPANQTDTLLLQSAYMEGKLWQDSIFMAKYPEADWGGAREFKVSDGYEPLIFDLDATDGEGESHLEELLAEGYTLLHVSKDLEGSGGRGQEAISALFEECASMGYRTAALTPANEMDAAAYIAKHGIGYPFYSTDPTELKIIVRSNPGVVLLKDGVVLEKWAWRDVPSGHDGLGVTP